MNNTIDDRKLPVPLSQPLEVEVSPDDVVHLWLDGNLVGTEPNLQE